MSAGQFFSPEIKRNPLLQGSPPWLTGVDILNKLNDPTYAEARAAIQELEDDAKRSSAERNQQAHSTSLPSLATALHNISKRTGCSRAPYPNSEELDEDAAKLASGDSTSAAFSPLRSEF